MLTPLGLTLNFLGPIVLLGTEVKAVKQALERTDPIHRVYLRALNKVVDESIDEEKLGKKQHPYHGPISPDDWSWLALCRFLDRHAEQDLSRNANVDISGGGFKVNGDDLTLPEKRIIQLNEKEQLRAGPRLSLNAVHGLMYEARMKRVYIYGVSLLALGFLLRLIDSLNLFTIVSVFL